MPLCAYLRDYYKFYLKKYEQIVKTFEKSDFDVKKVRFFLIISKNLLTKQGYDTIISVKNEVKIRKENKLWQISKIFSEALCLMTR